MRRVDEVMALSAPLVSTGDFDVDDVGDPGRACCSCAIGKDRCGKAVMVVLRDREWSTRFESQLIDMKGGKTFGC